MKYKIFIIVFLFFLVPNLCYAGESITAEASLCDQYTPFDLIVLTVKISNWSGRDVALTKKFACGALWYGSGLCMELEDTQGNKYLVSSGLSRDDPLTFFVLPAGKSVTFSVDIRSIDKFEKAFSKPLDSLPAQFVLTVDLHHKMPTSEHRKEYEKFAKANNALTWEGEVNLQPIEFEITRPLSTDELRLCEIIPAHYESKMNEWGQEPEPSPPLSYSWARSALQEASERKKKRIFPNSRIWDYIFATRNIYFAGDHYALGYVMDDGRPFLVRGFDKNLESSRTTEEKFTWFVEYLGKIKERRHDSPPFKPLIEQLEWLEVVALYKLGQIEEAETLKKKILESEPDNCFYFELKYVERYKEEAEEERKRREYFTSSKNSEKGTSNNQTESGNTETGNKDSIIHDPRQEVFKEKHIGTSEQEISLEKKVFSKPSVVTMSNIIISTLILVVLVVAAITTFLILRHRKVT